MSSELSGSYSDAQRREAAIWFVEIHSRTEPDIEGLHAWLRWMESADANRLAFEAVVAAWYAAPKSLIVALPSAEELANDSYDGSMPLTRWREKKALASPEPDEGAARTLSKTPVRPRPWFYWSVGIAAGVTVLCIGALLRLHDRLSGAGEYVTKTAERLDIALPDGSHISLGGKSRLYVSFTKSHRRVDLEAGEGYFFVAKDPARPFTVHALAADITAVGTVFDVRAVAERVTVAVSEGVVKVAPPASAPSMPATSTEVRVNAGEQLTVAAGGKLAVTVYPVGPTRQSDWRSGVLVYRNEPLRAVVADVSRYTDLRLDVAAGATGDLRYSGAVHSDAIAEWAQALPESFPVKLVSSADGLTIIAR